jgi:hypothetical protein
MEIRQSFVHFRQGFTLLRKSKENKTEPPGKGFYVGRRRSRVRSFLKKHWAYVLGFIVAFIFSLLITRFG